MIKTVLLSDESIEAGLKLLGDKTIIHAVMQNVMDGARAEWVKLAGSRLESSRRDYLNGIQKVEIKDFSATVALVGLVPNLVENGMDAFDMHATLLGPDVPVVPWGSGQKGKHEIKDSPGKFYRAIPFRHQTPGSIGQGGGTPMGKAYKGVVDDAAALGKAIHKAAVKLKATTGMPGEKPSWGGRLPEGLAPKLKSTHTTDIYAGMTKMAKGYKGATQVTYMTFRMISDNAPEKFLHPGLEGVHLADDVEKYVEKVAVLAFQALVGGL